MEHAVKLNLTVPWDVSLPYQDKKTVEMYISVKCMI